MSSEPVDPDAVVERMEVDPVEIEAQIRWLETRAAGETEVAGAAALVTAYQIVAAVDEVPESVLCSLRAAAVAAAAADAPSVDTDRAEEVLQAAFDLRDAADPESAVDDHAGALGDAADAVRLRRLDRVLQTTDLATDLDEARESLKEEAAAANSRLRAAGVLKGLRALRERGADVDVEDRALAERIARHVVDVERDRTSGARSPQPDGVGSVDTVKRFATHAATPRTEDDLTWPSIEVPGDDYPDALEELADETGVDEVLTATNARRVRKDLEREQGRAED